MFIFIIICSIISIIFSSLNIYKYYKIKNKSLELTKERKKIINITSIILGILSFINLSPSIVLLALGPNDIEYNKRLERKISFIQLIPTILMYILPFFCYLTFLFWHSLHDFRGSINGCEKCHSCCCCRKVESAITIKSTININGNNINNISTSNININVNNEPKSPGQEKEILPHETPKPLVPKPPIIFMKIHFKITTGKPYIIIEPSNLTIKELFDTFFEYFKIKETDRNSLRFLYGGEQLEVNSNCFIGNKLKEGRPIVVVDQKNITNKIK